MATLTVTLINPSTGQPISGLTNVKLWYGTAALAYAGVTPDTEIGLMTEEGTSGSYTRTITNTNAYTIKVGGVVNDEYTNVWISAEDIVCSTRLAELGTGTLTAGATLIGVNDPDGRYTATTLNAILNEISGARASVANANIAWLYAKVDGWTPSDGEINALTGSGITLAALQKLVAFTFTSSLANQVITGASANVTAANLSTLTGGGATTLHTHSSITAFTSIRGQQSGNHCLDLTINLDAFVSSGNGGDLLITTAPLGSGSWGIVSINGYQVITDFHLGSTNYTGTNFLGYIDPADDGAVERAIRELDSRIGTLWNLQFPGQNTVWRQLWNNATKAATGGVTPGSTPILASWTQTSGSTTTLVRVWLNPTDEQMWILRLKAYAKIAANTGTIIFRHEGSGTEVYITVNSASDTWYTTTEMNLPASYNSPQEFTIKIKGMATDLMTVYENLVIEGK